MIRSIRTWGVILCALAVATVGLVASPADAGRRHGAHEQMTRVPPEKVSPTGQSVAEDCGADANGAESWPSASARFSLSQHNGTSTVSIKMRHARPNTYYTLWLRLGGTDSDEAAYGRSPLTDIPATPLVNSQDLPVMLAATGPGNGNAAQPNGVLSDELGNATFRLRLDFSLVGGAYPFHRFPGFDPDDPRLPAANPAIRPVSIPGPQAPFTVMIASHCGDGVGHGLLPGPHEEWLSWTSQ
jgi:hypothetical protein